MKDTVASVLPETNRVKTNPVQPAEELSRHLRRLQKRQLELELQNFELRQQLLPIATAEQRVKFLDSISAGYVEIEHDGVIHQTNHAAADFLGCEPAELIGKNIFDFVAASDAEKFRKRCEQGQRHGEKTSMELRLQPRDGNTPMDAQILCWPASEARCGGLIFSDITPLKQAEEKIFRMAAFPALNPNPIIELAEDGTINWFNDAAQQLAHFLGSEQPHEILPPQTTEFVRECLRTRHSRLRHETVVADRHLFWSFFPVFPGRVVHCYGTDITERAQLEAQLRQTQKMESVGQLAAGVAHDFNNVLMIIQGYTNLLLTQRELPLEITEPLKQISVAGERATHLTKQLMTFSRKQAMQTKALDLSAVINNIAYLLQRLIGEDIAQQFQFAPNLPPIEADPGMMEQLVMNLAVNAHDAMPKGGKFTITTSAVQIGVEQVRHNPEARPGKFVCLTVSDTGCGMCAETVEKIFDPFFTTKETGTGLGLSTAYGIVKQHQGWIEVSSKPGQGSVFKIYFPAAAPPSNGKNLPEPKASGGNETIFVVEDEPALRGLVVRHLQKAGYKIVEASSGAEALEVWARHADEIDLLFTDMVMPDGMTGRDLAETLQAQKPDLKILYTSGYSQEVVEQDFGLRRGSNFLQKPHQSAVLLKAVRVALEEEKVNA